MTTQLLEMEVIYRDGAFHPVDEVSLPISEGQSARVLVKIEEKSVQNKPRVAGLHAGMGWISDDFDDELPDSFWLGEE